MLLVIGATLLVSILLLTGCGRYGGSEEIYSKEVLSENAKDLSHTYDYASDYLDRWDFPRFDIRKMREVENIFLSKSLYDAPSAPTHAQALAEFFIDRYYDEIDLSNPTEVTDALLECYALSSGDEWAKYRSTAKTASYEVQMSGEGERSVSYSIENYLGSEVGYIKIGSFKQNTAEQFTEAIDYMEANGVPGFVFDLRDNAGGYIKAAVDAINYLIPVDKKIVTYREKGKAAEVIRATITHNISVPCVVLCNENTASAAELFVAAMRDYKILGLIDVTVIGEMTYGKGVVQSTVSLDDGSSLTLTTAYFDAPLDENFTESGAGIKPDVVSLVSPTERDDQQLNDSLDHISYLVQLYSGTVDKDRFREKLIEAMAKTEGVSYKYFADYLKKWGIPIYDNTKLHEVQDVFYSWLNPTMTTAELAYATAIEFIDKHYDALSVSEKNETTEALIKAWLSVCDKNGVYRTEKEAQVYLDELNGRTVGLGLSWEQSSHKVIKVTEGSDAYGKLQIGDIIASVNGLEYTFRTETTKDNYADIVRAFTDASKTSFEISVVRDGVLIENITIKRSVIDTQTVLWKIHEGVLQQGNKMLNVAQITISSFNAKTYTQFKAAIDELEGKVDAYVFDLRSNLGGPLEIVMKCIDYLVADEHNGYKTKLTSIKYFKDGRTEARYAEDGHSVGKTPCVVICDTRTTAAAELFTAALKDYGNTGLMNSSVVGNTTFGKGTMQETKWLYDSTAITITVADYYPPLGESSGYNGIGVEPIVTVANGASSQTYFDTAMVETARLLKAAISQPQN